MNEYYVLRKLNGDFLKILSYHEDGRGMDATWVQRLEDATIMQPDERYQALLLNMFPDTYCYPVSRLAKIL